MRESKAVLAKRPLWAVRDEKEGMSVRENYRTPEEAIESAEKKAARGSTEWDGFRRMIVVERLGELKMGYNYRWNRSRSVLLSFGWTRVGRRRGREIIRVDIDPVRSDTLSEQEKVGSVY